MPAESELGVRCWRAFKLAAHSTVLLSVAGCMSLQPQLPPTDFAELERISDREEREVAYAEHAIVEHKTSTGIRYTKGTHPNATKRGWQSLDKVLRSDASSAAALPVKKARRARFLAASGELAPKNRAIHKPVKRNKLDPLLAVLRVGRPRHPREGRLLGLHLQPHHRATLLALRTE